MLAGYIVKQGHISDTECLVLLKLVDEGNVSTYCVAVATYTVGRVTAFQSAESAEKVDAITLFSMRSMFEFKRAHILINKDNAMTLDTKDFYLIYIE